MRTALVFLVAGLAVAACGSDDATGRADETSATQGYTAGGYTPPSYSARREAAKQVTSPVTEDSQTTSGSLFAAPTGTAAPPSPAPARPPLPRNSAATADPTVAGVTQYYERELNLHRGDTLPQARPAPPPAREDSSWLGFLFGSDDPETAANLPQTCYSGQLTGEGRTCQAMRTEDGRLLTLGGPLRGFGPGDRVCVCGPVAATSFCEQGTTIYIADISETCTAR